MLYSSFLVWITLIYWNSLSLLTRQPFITDENVYYEKKRYEYSTRLVPIRVILPSYIQFVVQPHEHLKDSRR